MIASFITLQLFSAYNFGKSSANSHLIVSYIIVIQYINTPKLCIVTPLLYVYVCIDALRILAIPMITIVIYTGFRVVIIVYHLILNVRSVS